MKTFLITSVLVACMASYTTFSAKETLAKKNIVEKKEIKAQKKKLPKGCIPEYEVYNNLGHTAVTGFTMTINYQLQGATTHYNTTGIQMGESVALPWYTFTPNNIPSQATYLTINFDANCWGSICFYDRVTGDFLDHYYHPTSASTWTYTTYGVGCGMDIYIMPGAGCPY